MQSFHIILIDFTGSFIRLETTGTPWTPTDGNVPSVPLATTLVIVSTVLLAVILVGLLV
jgi:hypothetical protein